MPVFLNFATHVDCADPYCPLNDYGAHSHTYYNVYGVPRVSAFPGMSEIDAAEYATIIRPLEIVPFYAVKDVQNV